MKTLYKLDGTPVINDLLQLSDTESGQVVLPNKDIQYWKKSPDGTLELWGVYTSPQGSSKFVLPFSITVTRIEMIQTTCSFSNHNNVIYTIGETRSSGCDVYPTRYDLFNTFYYYVIGRWK